MKQSIKNRRILVTGGAGFIGSNLVKVFLEQNNEVVCLDNYSTGKKENIEEFSVCKKFKFIEGDIRDLKTCIAACDGIDFIFHEAALGSVPRSIKEPIMYYENNVLGTANMLEAARRARVKRFIYASSSSVYGDDNSPIKKELSIGTACSPYAAGKYATEVIAENYSNVYDLETVGLRYFNVFGKNQDPMGAYAAVIPKFIFSLMEHKSPTINGDGSYSRDFTYIDNVLQANILAALTPIAGITQKLTDEKKVSTCIYKRGNSIFNVAYGKRTTLNELFTILRENLTRYDNSIAKIEPTYGPYRAGDIPHSLADVTKAKELLCYNPEYSAPEGLALTVDWYWKKYPHS